MTSINLTAHNNTQKGWNRSFSPRVARTGIVVIVAAVAVLGLVSVSFGSNSDQSRPASPSAIAH